MTQDRNRIIFASSVLGLIMGLVLGAFTDQMVFSVTVTLIGSLAIALFIFSYIKKRFLNSLPLLSENLKKIIENDSSLNFAPLASSPHIISLFDQSESLSEVLKNHRQACSGLESQLNIYGQSLDQLETQAQELEKSVLAQKSLLKEAQVKIHELRSAESSLISARDAALKNSQAKSEFLAKMSHEIRTPMNAIMGAAELLKETKLDADQEYYVTIFCKAGEVLLSLVNDILDLSKIEAGEVAIENIPFDLKKLLNDVEDIMKPRASEKGLQYHSSVQAGVSTYLTGDPHKLRQVLINLVGNSLKFTEKGSVTLSVVKNPSRKDSMLFSVTDTGLGIPEEKQGFIFQKFSQADNTINRRFGGTGLGLAISKSLIELMGGQIWFKSREGQGTTFYFTLPYHEQLVPLTKPLALENQDLDFVATKPRCPNKKIRILVADDTDDNRTLFTHFLKNEPYEIIEAHNGLEAIDKIKSSEFDIVFMDVQMPEMDGYAATNRIRQWEAEIHKKPTPIIALTAHALSEDRQKSLQAGCNDHIAKPFKRETLVKVINRYSM